MFLFAGTKSRVIFACMYTCPWYWAAYEDRGLQAKHNSIFVVFARDTGQVLSPVSPHVLEASNIIEKVRIVFHYYRKFSEI